MFTGAHKVSTGDGFDKLQARREVPCRVEDLESCFIPAIAEECRIGIDELTCSVVLEAERGWVELQMGKRR